METKERHGCVTAWLIFVIVVNSIVGILYLISAIGAGMYDTISPTMLLLLTVLSVINVICAVMLLQWKKVGFFGFVGTSIVAFIINLSLGMDTLQALFGLVGIAVLYAVLQIKKDEIKTWDNLA